MDFDLVKKIFDGLYAEVDGYSLSALARGKLNYSDKTLTYGEVIPESFYKILSETQPKKGEIFYDLGSGTGKAVFLAALFFDFSRSVGIEILEDLHQAARRILLRYNQEIKKSLPSEKQKQVIDFIKTNFFDFDFSDGDVIFAHCTCLYDQMMEALSQKLEGLKKGTRVITTTKTLSSCQFIQRKVEAFQMGWGKSTVYFYEKIA